MFNFSPHPSTRKASSGEFFLKYHQITSPSSGSSPSIMIFNDRPCSAGEQLFEDYGDVSDDIYLLHHGFVPSFNAFRCIDLSITSLQSAAKYRSTYQLLHSMELLKSSTVSAVQHCVEVNGNLSDQLLVAFATMAMTEGEAEYCHNFITKQTSRNWREIFETCGYAKVIQDMKTFIAEKEADVITSSLSLRTLEEIQEWLPSSSLPHIFVGTLHEDESFFASTSSSKSLSHLLAIEYRMAMKQTWLDICDIYRVECVIPSLESLSILQGQQWVTSLDDESTPFDERLRLFNDWFNSFAPPVNLVQAVSHSLYRVSVLAVQDIAIKSTYLSVPDVIIMDVKKAEAEPLLSLLFRRIKANRGPVDPFHKLLFFLLYHRFFLAERSKFWPYLSLLPTPNEMDLPLLWSEETIEDRLSPSALGRVALKEKEETISTFTFLSKNDELKEFFPSSVLTFSHYCWAKAILNSRSIWWNSERHLVPLLDFINHAEGPDPTAVHTTQLDGSKSFAITNACKNELISLSQK